MTSLAFSNNSKKGDIFWLDFIVFSFCVSSVLIMNWLSLPVLTNNKPIMFYLSVFSGAPVVFLITYIPIMVYVVDISPKKYVFSIIHVNWNKCIFCCTKSGYMRMNKGNFSLNKVLHALDAKKININFKFAKQD